MTSTSLPDSADEAVDAKVALRGDKKLTIWNIHIGEKQRRGGHKKGNRRAVGIDCVSGFAADYIHIFRSRVNWNLDHGNIPRGKYMKSRWMKVTLARIALTAWLAWLLALGIMACLSFARVLHASFLYMAIPLVVQLICTFAVFGGGIWRIIRGPGRWNTVAWMLFGALPTLWIGAYLEYLLNFGAGRIHRPNLLIYWAEAASSLIGEPYVRVFYPYRYEGERFVMWSDSPKCDEKQMAAMDAHILAMEKSLGRRSDYKVYWVRGPVWGIGGKYVFGWAWVVHPRRLQTGPMD